MSMTTESQPLATGGASYPGAGGEDASPSDRLAAATAALQGQPEAAPPAAAPGQPDAAASGSETPADQQPATTEPALVPSFRLREETERRQALEQQLSQFAQYEGWAPVIDALAQRGYSPEQIAQAIEQQQAEAAAPPGAIQQPAAEQQQQHPLASFETYLAAKGIDPEWLGVVEQAQWQEMYEHAVFRHEAQARQEWAEQRTAQAELESDLRQVTTQYPFFQAPTWQEALVATAGRMLDQNPNLPQRQVLMRAAERLHQELEAHTQGKLATTMAQKAGDAQFPVTAGGSAPAPVEPVDITKMTSEQRRRHVEAALTGG